MTHHTRAKKSLGQHFLTSEKVLHAIITAADLSEKDTVLEIGPGKGVLTEKLLENAGRVIAVEKDSALMSALKNRFTEAIENKRLSLIEDDILSFIPKESGLMTSGYKLIANIPYYITGQILRQFIGGDVQPTHAVLLMQKEVAERIVARDGKEGLLSLSVKAYGTARIVAKVPPGAFAPPPSVDSAVLEIGSISRKRFEETGISEERFFTLIRYAFRHKRKQLQSNLRDQYDARALEYACEKASVSPKTRAEDVLLKQWFTLANTLDNTPPLSRS